MLTLQIEWLKLKRPANYVLLALLLLFTLVYTVIGFYIFKDASSGNLHTILIAGEQTLLNLLLAIFISINIGKEYSENTLRRGVIEGYTRHQFFTGKLLLVLVSCVVLFLITLLGKMAIGLGMKQWSGVAEYFTVSGLTNTLVDFLWTGIFTFFLAFLTRSTAISIVLYFVWPIAEGLAQFAEKLVAQKTNWTHTFTNYLPNASVNMMTHSKDIMATHFVFVITFYFLVMMLLPYWLFLKRDIK